VVVERSSAHGSFIEVLDRVLDKGLVIDAGVRFSIAGIQLIGVEARVVVVSIPTYLKFSATVAETTTAARPASPAPRSPAAVPTEARLDAVDGRVPLRRESRLRVDPRPGRLTGGGRWAAAATSGSCNETRRCSKTNVSR